VTADGARYGGGIEALTAAVEVDQAGGRPARPVAIADQAKDYFAEPVIGRRFAPTRGSQ
jgi:hypothetical protein